MSDTTSYKIFDRIMITAYTYTKSPISYLYIFLEIYLQFQEYRFNKYQQTSRFTNIVTCLSSIWNKISSLPKLHKCIQVQNK